MLLVPSDSPELVEQELKKNCGFSLKGQVKRPVTFFPQKLVKGGRFFFFFFQKSIYHIFSKTYVDWKKQLYIPCLQIISN